MRSANLTICFICAAVMLVIIAGTYAIDIEDNRTTLTTVNIMKSNFLFNVLCFFMTLLEDGTGPLHIMIRLLEWLSFFLVLYWYVAYVYTYTNPDEDPRKKRCFLLRWRQSAFSVRA